MANLRLLSELLGLFGSAQAPRYLVSATRFEQNTYQNATGSFTLYVLNAVSFVAPVMHLSKTLADLAREPLFLPARCRRLPGVAQLRWLRSG